MEYFQLIYLGIFLVGLMAGVFSGLFGIGGGIVMVPTLIAVFGMNMLCANAASLTAMLLPVGILGVMSFYKAGLINLRDSAWIAAGLLCGSFFGARIALAVDVSLLAKLYALFLLYIALEYMGVPDMIMRKKKTVTEEHGEKVHRQFWTFMLLGVFAGTIAGMFGKGGGIIIVPILVKLFHYDAKAASATSLAALQLPVGLPSVVVYAQGGYLNWAFAILMAVGLTAGAFFGSKVALKMPSKLFKRIWAVFLLGVAAYMVWKFL